MAAKEMSQMTPKTRRVKISGRHPKSSSTHHALTNLTVMSVNTDDFLAPIAF